MSYPVIWNPRATDHIDDAWRSARVEDQQNILDALNNLQELLGDSPFSQGESRTDVATRVLTFMPVTVHYRIIERLGVVRVFAAASIGKAEPNRQLRQSNRT